MRNQKLAVGVSHKALSAGKKEFDFSEVLPTHVMPEDVPVLIRKTAEEIAGAFYEDERTPVFRARWVNQTVYVKLNWASFVPVARTVLTHMLEDATVSLAQKEEIYGAFLEQAQDKRMMDLSEHIGANLAN